MRMAISYEQKAIWKVRSFFRAFPEGFFDNEVCILAQYRRRSIIHGVLILV